MSCELPEAFEEHERKARKDHICCECLETIAAGASYRYRRAYEVDEGPPFGHLVEEIRNEYGYHGDTTLAGLTTPAQLIDKASELWLAEKRRP